jgi:hypothetical protein
MPQPRLYSSHAQRQAAYRQRQQQARQQGQEQRGLPPLPTMSTLPGDARWNAALEQVRLLLEQVCQEMEDYYDERTKRWKDSDRGFELRRRLKTLQGLIWDLGDVAG